MGKTGHDPGRNHKMQCKSRRRERTLGTSYVRPREARLAVIGAGLWALGDGEKPSYDSTSAPATWPDASRTCPKSGSGTGTAAASGRASAGANVR